MVAIKYICIVPNNFFFASLKRVVLIAFTSHIVESLLFYCVCISADSNKKDSEHLYTHIYLFQNYVC